VFETTFGMGQRNIFRQAFQKRADISLVKNTRISDRVNVKYTFDVYNLTNTSSFDIPGNSVGIGSGNTNPAYDSTMSSAANIATQYSLLSLSNNQGLGQVTNTIGGPRNIQMSLRVIY